MDVRQGDTLHLLVKAADRFGRYIREGTAAVSVWAGEGYPHELEVHEAPAAWDASARGYTALIDTTDWAPGTYVVTGEVRGQASAGPVRGHSEPQSFTITPPAILDHST